MQIVSHWYLVRKRSASWRILSERYPPMMNRIVVNLFNSLPLQILLRNIPFISEIRRSIRGLKIASVFYFNMKRHSCCYLHLSLRRSDVIAKKIRTEYLKRQLEWYEFCNKMFYPLSAHHV